MFESAKYCSTCWEFVVALVFGSVLQLHGTLCESFRECSTFLIHAFDILYKTCTYDVLHQIHSVQTSKHDISLYYDIFTGCRKINCFAFIGSLNMAYANHVDTEIRQHAHDRITVGMEHWLHTLFMRSVHVQQLAIVRIELTQIPTKLFIC